MPVSVIPGEEMLDRMARGNGFGGNSSFLIRASAYHRVGGHDPEVRYAGDYELAARLCRAGEYVHIDEPLFYGRMHPANSSTVDTRKCLDTVDWFEIPEKRRGDCTGALAASTAVGWFRRNLGWDHQLDRQT
jgi:GT2 family glycosyltransferase